MSCRISIVMVRTVRSGNEVADRAVYGEYTDCLLMLLFVTYARHILVNVVVYFRLTAFVVRSFSRAKSYIYIDPDSLSKSVTFILRSQQKDGSFTETGHVSSYLQVRCTHLNAKLLPI